MSTLRKALVVFLLLALFAAKLGRSFGHSLLQFNSSRPEFNCTLTPEALQPFSSGQGRWLVTNSTLQDLDGDIQRLVDCTEEGDVLLFDLDAPVQPSRRIIIRWNLTLSSFVEDPPLPNGTFMKAMRKVTFLCPRQDEGVFIVEASESLFANFAFRSCSLNRRGEGAQRGIITIASCNATRNLGTVKLHHVDFEENVLRRSAALYVQEPSCSSIQILHVRFQYNFCAGVCAAHLPTHSEIQDIRLTGNRFFEDAYSDHVLIAIESAPTVTISRLNASANDGIAVRVRRSDLMMMSNSHIFQNSGGLGQDEEHHTGGVSFISSSGAILDSLFEENTGYVGSSITVADSNLAIVRTRVIGCTSTRRGGGISITRSSNVSILDSVIANNSAGLSGGGVDAYKANRLEIGNSSFEMNAAETGAGLYFFSGALTVRDSNFTGNRASKSGGGGYVNSCLYSFNNLALTGNEAPEGGGLAMFQSNGSLSNSHFERNSVESAGGGLYMRGSYESVVGKCSFDQNTANVGGALVSYNSITEVLESSFVSNVASANGGAISSQGSGNMTLEGCSFVSNSANGDGGALSATETVLSLRNISLVSCTSVSGGGIYLERTSASINETSVTFCEASGSGGGIRMIESDVISSGLDISLNTAAGTSRHESEGGGIAMESSCTLSVRNAIFAGNMAQYGAGNMAQYGAGIFGIGRSVVFISNGRFNNNSAMSNGGAAYLQDSSLTLQRGSCLENNATIGGCVYVFNSNLTLNRSELINSYSTDAGGSVLAQGGTIVVIEETRVQSSSAINGGGIMLINSILRGFRVQFQNCSARMHGGGVALNESSSFLCTNCLFEGNNASQKGGALRLESVKPQMLAFQLENTVFRDNDAAFGGGIHFQTGDKFASCSEVNSTECTFLALTGCSFRNNHARHAGGAILANNPMAIRISCQLLRKTSRFEYYTREELGAMSELSSLDGVCENWTNNTAATYGPIVGSYARQVTASVLPESNRTMEIQSNRYVLRNHSSGYPLPTISLEAVDEFSQSPALIQANQQINGVATAEDRLFDGNVPVRMKDGRGKFSGITAFKEPGMYAIHINFSGTGISTVTIDIEIRECLIGEARTGNGTMCEPCGDTTYNFNPLKNEECITCPDGAMCDSRAIRPKNGFWHQTPCSSHVQLCLSEIACDEKERDAKLKALGSNIENCTFDDEFSRNYSEALCREGYTGPLCGSCNSTHGKTRSFRCEECYGTLLNVSLLIVVGLVLLGLAAFTIKGVLPARQRSASRNHSRRGASSSRSVNFQMVEMWCTGRVPPEVIHPHLRTQGNGANTASAQQLDQRNAELAKWKASEIFKITINYLQGIAIAITVNVAWTGALIALFETAEFIGGMTAEAANHSTDCLVSANSSIPRSAVTTIVNLLTPVVVAASFAVLWTIAKIRNKQSFGYLIKRCILSAMVVSYLSYIAVTKTAVNIFYCVKVYDSDDFDDDLTTKYWAVDTALKCFDGSHSMLSFVFGLPVLLLFSVGFPCLVTCVLVMKRRQEDIQSPWLYETAGFLYRSYNEKFIFWESVVLLRKAALAIIVVFAYPLGGNLQGILAVCVLVVALYLQLHCRPYRSEFDMLNRLEGLSLLVSSLTFVSGLFLNDDRTSSEARATISALIVFANVILFFYLFVRFFVASAAYLRIVLDNEGVAYDQSASAFHIVKTYLKHKLDLHLGSALRRVTAFLSRHDEEPDTNVVEIKVASVQ